MVDNLSHTLFSFRIFKAKKLRNHQLRGQSSMSVIFPTSVCTLLIHNVWYWSRKTGYVRLEISITQLMTSQSPLREGWSHIQGVCRYQREGQSGKDKNQTAVRQTQDTPRNKGMLPPCCNTVDGPIGSAETITLRKQARCAGDITPTGGLSWMGAGGRRGGSSGLGADTLSLLIIVWLLRIFKYTFPWHKRCNRRGDVTLRLQEDGKRQSEVEDKGHSGQCTRWRQTIWSLHMRAIGLLEAGEPRRNK